MAQPEIIATVFHKRWRQLLNFSQLFHLVAEADKSKQIGHLTVNQARIFGYFFAHSEEDVHLKDLARVLNVTSAAASQAVERLVQAGLVERKISMHDRRAIILCFSRKGRELIEKIDHRHQEILIDLLQEESEEDIRIFIGVFTRLYARLNDRWNNMLSAKEQRSGI